MNFRLIYEGRLPTSGTAKEKQAIRSQLHPQLAELWKQPPLLTRVEQGQHHIDSVVQPSLAFELGGFLFVPVVTTRLNLMAHLDILFLRPGSPGSLIMQGGDIDNRLKTLFDALQIPDQNQIAAVPPGQAHIAQAAAPFFCLLENDALITRVAVETDRLLSPDVAHVGESRVVLVINVALRATQLSWANLDLVG